MFSSSRLQLEMRRWQGHLLTQTGGKTTIGGLLSLFKAGGRALFPPFYFLKMIWTGAQDLHVLYDPVQEIWWLSSSVCLRSGSISLLLTHLREQAQLVCVWTNTAFQCYVWTKHSLLELVSVLCGQEHKNASCLSLTTSLHKHSFFPFRPKPQRTLNIFMNMHTSISSQMKPH